MLRVLELLNDGAKFKYKFFGSRILLFGCSSGYLLDTEKNGIAQDNLIYWEAVLCYESRDEVRLNNMDMLLLLPHNSHWVKCNRESNRSSGKEEDSIGASLKEQDFAK